MSNNQSQVVPFEKEPDFDEDKETNEKLSPIEIQNKIIAYFELGRTDLSDNSGVEIVDDTKDEFLKKIANGEIGDQQFQDLIKDLLLVDQPENKELVALYEEQISAIKEEALQKYPEFDVQKAQKDTENVVTSLRAADGSSLLAENKLGWDNDSMRIAEETARSHEGIGKVEMIYPARSREIVEQVADDENAKFNQDKQKLLEAGLTPKYRLQIGPRIINFSLGCELGNGYTAVIGYVETDNKVVAQTFYRDNGLGTWRYANEDPTTPDQKGLFVPTEIQNFLSEITASGQPKIDVKNARDIFPEVLTRNVP
ncbi:MAG: hypothetical protein Q7S37_02045 [bacterium]|nr:hypothetical protein [bacterium]